MSVANDEEQIRTLIERWAVAVHSGDMAGVLEDHSDDIVMFDVPPPYEGVRGIDTYRQTWPRTKAALAVAPRHGSPVR